MPATTVLVSSIFVDPCLVKRTKLFRQPSGSDEGAGAITLRGSHKLLRVGTIRSPAACRGCDRGRPFLSERPKNNRSRYYKGGLAKRNPPLRSAIAVAWWVTP